VKCSKKFVDEQKAPPRKEENADLDHGFALDLDKKLT